MRTVGTIIILFGVLVGLGGFLGYVQAKSMVSLVMGFGFGVCLVVAGWAILANKEWGEKAALALSIALAVFFGLRFLGSHKMMPAGVILILSTIAIMALLVSRANRR